MREIKEILVPTDFSESAKAALGTAFGLWLNSVVLIRAEEQGPSACRNAKTSTRFW